MKLNLKDLFEDNVEDVCGSHIIYRIHSIDTGMSYIGEIQQGSLKKRFLKSYSTFSYTHQENYLLGTYSEMYIDMNLYGVDRFEVYIEHVSSEYNPDLEETFITKFDSYLNGYNNSWTGKAWTGRERTIKGRVTLTNGTRDVKIKKRLVDKFLQANPDFRVGSKSKGSKVPSNNGVNFKVRVKDPEGKTLTVRKGDLGDYLERGYSVCGSCNSSIYINDGVRNKRVQPEVLQSYLDSGWKKGMTYNKPTGLITYLNNPDGERKMVLKTEKDELLSKGWTPCKIIGGGRKRK